MAYDTVPTPPSTSYFGPGQSPHYNWPWYQYTPSGAMADWQTELLESYRTLNRLLPHFGLYDVPEMARTLSTAFGGAEGPFAGYTEAPSPTGYSYGGFRQGLGETIRGGPAAGQYRLQRGPRPTRTEEGVLSEAQQIVMESALDPDLRAWIQGALDMALDLTRSAEPESYFARTREEQLRLQQGLESYLGSLPEKDGYPIEGAEEWSGWLSRLILPTRLRPLPGGMSVTPGYRQGYSIIPNPQWY